MITNKWLHYMADGRRKPRSIKIYEIQILHFFTWLEVNRLDWITIKQKQLLDYKRYLEKTITATGRLRSEYTTRIYMRTVIRFYRWAYNENYISDLPFDGEVVPGLEGGGIWCLISPNPIRKSLREISQEQNENYLRYAFMLLTGMRIKEISDK